MRNNRHVTFQGKNYKTDESKFMVEMGYSVSPSNILKVLKSSKKLSLSFLDGKDTCDNLQLGKLLGEGKNGSVFEIPEDDSNSGLPVVLKRFEIKKHFDIHVDADDQDYNGDATEKGTAARKANESSSSYRNLYVLSSSLNEIAISSVFSSFYSGDDSTGNNPNMNYCVNFPYFEGFFSCENDGYVITEKLENTLSGFYASDKFSYKAFKVILFQMLFGIKFMVRHGMVHNDLHGKNGMMRYTKGVSYRGKKLDNYDYFRYEVKNPTGNGNGDNGMSDPTTINNNGEGTSKFYDVPNIGIIGKVVDLDFACKYSYPQLAPKKVHNKQEDEWNLQFRYSTSYDFLVFIGYSIYYSQIKGVYRDGDKCAELTEELAKYVVSVVHDSGLEITRYDHMDKSGKKYSRIMMDMLSVPSYRPHESFCHLDLSGVLDIDAFAEFRKKGSSSSTKTLKVAELS